MAAAWRQLLAESTERARVQQPPPDRVRSWQALGKSPGARPSESTPGQWEGSALPFTFALPASTFLRRCSCSSSSISLQASSRDAREVTGPTRRRLRSIYTPSPLPGLALPCDNCHADVSPPLSPGSAANREVTFLPSRTRAPNGAAGVGLRPCRLPATDWRGDAPINGG